MNLLHKIFGSSVGKKFVMAITGFGLVLFVIGHMLGNLQIFLGQDKINDYGTFLQSKVEFIWLARISLLVLVILHIWSAIKLSAENKAARPVAYANYKVVAASYASRTMLMSGLIVFCFIVYHLLHYTVQIPAVNLQDTDFKTLHDAQQRHDIYRMMIVGFSHPLVSGFYILGVALLALHLSHGISSMFQSLGWRKRTYVPILDGIAKSAGIVLFLGYSAIPIAVLAGFFK